LAQSIGYDD
jgi:serine/threonine-protein phosphatase 5